MKALRVLKWLSFVVFILSMVLAIAGHGFVMYEMNIMDDDKADNILMDEIKDALKDAKPLDNLFGGAKAEETADEGTAAPAETGEDTPADEITPLVPAENEPAAETKDDSAAYSVEGKNNIIVAVMKYGTMSIELPWLAKLIKIDSFEIVLTMLIAYVALFITVLFHVISKSYKTFYGLLLMIVGYLFFAVIVAGGYYFANGFLKTIGAALEGDDWTLIRTVLIAMFFALGSLIGLPIYSCGIRQMTIKRLKRRLQRRNAR